MIEHRGNTRIWFGTFSQMSAFAKNQIAYMFIKYFHNYIV